MMKVLLVGGTGCLSTDIARKLCNDDNYELYMLNRGNNRNVIPQKTNLIIADIRNKSQSIEKLGNLHFDVVIDFISYFPRQLSETLDILAGHYNQFIFISSAAVYDIRNIGKHEITENSPVGNKEWWYSKGKIKCEELLAEYFMQKKEKYTIVRPFVTYNEERLPYALAPDYHHTWTIIRRILEDKPIVIWDEFDCVSPFTSTLDFADGVISLFCNENSYGEAYHIATDKQYSWRRVFEIIGNLLCKEPKYLHITNKEIEKYFPEYKDTIEDDKCFDYYVNNGKIKSMCKSFTYPIELEDGMKRMLDYHTSNISAQNIDYLWDARMDILIYSVYKNRYSNILQQSFYKSDNYKFSRKEKLKLFIYSNQVLYKLYRMMR